jgi:outer membrane protein OmpA-like peptidoglycan-associated protein
MASGVGLAIVSAVACASAPPPKELLDARAAYQRAQSGPAEQLSPAALHDAKTSLARAEKAYKDDSDSPETRDLAYVAERRSELAEVEAARVESERTRQRAEAMLSAAQSQMAARGGRTQQQIATINRELEAERRAREEAEARAREALDKLAAANAATVRNEQRGTVITVPGRVIFGTGKSDLLSGAKLRLNEIADALKDEKDHQILVEGHTDSTGTPEKNQELSQRRADSVRDYIVSRGVPADQVKAVGMGESHPIADNSTPVGRAANRRVEIIVQPVPQEQNPSQGGGLSNPPQGGQPQMQQNQRGAPQQNQGK